MQITYSVIRRIFITRISVALTALVLLLVNMHAYSQQGLTYIAPEGGMRTLTLSNLHSIDGKKFTVQDKSWTGTFLTNENTSFCIRGKKYNDISFLRPVLGKSVTVVEKIDPNKSNVNLAYIVYDYHAQIGIVNNDLAPIFSSCD